MACTATNGDHIISGHAHILSCDIASIQTVDCARKGRNQFGRLGAAPVGQDYAFAPAHIEASHSIFIAHPARKAQRIGNCRGCVGVVPEARTAAAGAPMSRVNRYNSAQAAAHIAKEMNTFVIIKVWHFPK